MNYNALFFRSRLLVFSCFILFVAIGCQSLPDGTPPKGDIVEPFVPSTALPTRAKALNHMVTEFTMQVAMLPSSGRPVVSLLLTDDVLGNELGQNLIDELKREGVVGRVGETHYILKSSSHILGGLKKGGKAISWKVALVSNGKTVVEEKKIVFKTKK